MIPIFFVQLMESARMECWAKAGMQNIAKALYKYRLGAADIPTALEFAGFE